MNQLIKYSLLLILPTLCSLGVKGQDEEINLKLRHIKGVQGTDVSFGITKFGNYAQASYVKFLKDKFLIRPSFSYEMGKIGQTKYQEFSLFIEVNRDIFSFKELFFVSTGLAPAVQLQNTSNDIVRIDKTYYPLGIMMNVNVELFIFNKATVFGTISEIYSPKDKFGPFRYLAGGGVKIYF